jgi:amino acid transporter
MRWKDVFLIWLLADAFLACGVLVVSVLFQGPDSPDITFLLGILGIGFLLSLPSLAVMSIFYFIYKPYSNSNYFLPYTLLILLINLVYSIVICYFFFAGDTEIMFVGLFPFFAGMLGLTVVHYKIQKRIQYTDIAEL